MLLLEVHSYHSLQGKQPDEDMATIQMTMLRESHGRQVDQQGHRNGEGGLKVVRLESPGGGLNQVRVHLGIQELSVVKWMPRTHPDPVFNDPHIYGEII
jgi:hypothetical protein